jgi:hypothetical protein
LEILQCLITVYQAESAEAVRKEKYVRYSQTKSLIVENNAQERFIDVDVPVGVLDEAQIPEFVHEGINPGARCSNHFR